MAPYSKVTHAITFAPVDVGTFLSHYIVSFSHCDGGGGLLELELHGTATDVPIHIPDSLHDLRCCVYNKVGLFSPLSSQRSTSSDQFYRR